MTEWLDMGGYAFFVWGSYGVFTATMIYLLISAVVKGRLARKAAAEHLRRQQLQEAET